MKTLKDRIKEDILFESNTAGAKLKSARVEVGDADAGEGMGESQRSFSIGVDLWLNFALNKPMQIPADDDETSSLDSKEFKQVKEKIESSAFKNHITNFFK